MKRFGGGERGLGGYMGQGFKRWGLGLGVE